jgi:tRNA(fMet)-specific endonuclease VapC
MLLLDTDILIDITKRKPDLAALEWYKSLSDISEIAIVQVVCLELLQGSIDKVDLNKLIKFLSKYKRVFHTEEDQKKAEIILREHGLASRIGIGDCLVAATAIRLNTILYTRNRKHFESVKELKLKVPY